MTKHAHLALWALFLVAASAAFSLIFACSAPLVAVAVVASVILPLRHALVALVGAWLLNQAIGYGVLGYPVDAMSFAWGGIIGLCSLIALALVQLLLPQAARYSNMVKYLLLFAPAFIAYELSMFGIAALIADGTDSFTADIVGHVLATNAIAMVFYAVAHWLLSKLPFNHETPSTAI